MCAAPCAVLPVCAACHSAALQTKPRCPRCATPQGIAYGAHYGSVHGTVCGACISKPPAFDAAVCVGDFDAPLSELIWQLKFREKTVLAPYLAGLLSERLHGLGIGLIVPVPLFHTRLAERGFNQSWEIVKALKGTVPTAHALTRLRDTPSQRSVSAAQRFSNVRHAFAADASVRGLHVLLVDDVVTTTATVQACSQALKVAGAQRVTVACIARVSD